jgi:hypothetical protein
MRGNKSASGGTKTELEAEAGRWGKRYHMSTTSEKKVCRVAAIATRCFRKEKLNKGQTAGDNSNKSSVYGI